MKNRVAPEVEEAVVAMAEEYPAYGQVRAANELWREEILVSPGGAAPFGCDMVNLPFRVLGQ